ncbi:MAG: thermonuclease family protein [Deltaproteobacteria bacterium]|nr:thermonuclease family protein [Deltaproteobacteria bacterium]
MPGLCLRIWISSTTLVNDEEMMKDYIRWPLVVVMIIVLMGLYHWAKALDLHDVRKVYDGDTIQLDDGRKIRLIGVDAPEVKSPYSEEEPFGLQSKRYLSKLLLGKKVYIKTAAVQYDKYGRTLAYVYMDDVLLNGRIIKDGWARAYVRFDYEYRDLFISYEKEAKARGIGIWSQE